MERNFIFDCLFFQSKEYAHKWLGALTWINIIITIIILYYG